MNVRGLSFNDDPENKTRLYACGKCGLCYSPKAYACGEDKAHEAASRAAEECCAPVHCKDCGCIIEKYRTLCSNCAETRKVRKATPVWFRDWSDPVYLEGTPDWCGWGEGYQETVKDLLDACAAEWMPEPAYCWPCTCTPLALNAESLLEHAVDDMHEDAMDEIVDADGLVAFIEAWNANQTCETWYPDYSRVVVLDRERFERMLK